MLSHDGSHDHARMVIDLCSAETMCRSMQVAEARHRNRLQSSTPDASVDTHLYKGTDLVRGNVTLAPLLQKFFKDELAREYARAKELRKCREDRAVARPKKQGNI